MYVFPWHLQLKLLSCKPKKFETEKASRSISYTRTVKVYCILRVTDSIISTSSFVRVKINMQEDEGWISLRYPFCGAIF